MCAQCKSILSVGFLFSETEKKMPSSQCIAKCHNNLSEDRSTRLDSSQHQEVSKAALCGYTDAH